MATDYAAYFRARGLADWHRHVGQALAAHGCGVLGSRCLKCRYPRGDRRRPARHHRACPLRGAGRWQVVLRLIETALRLRALALSGDDLTRGLDPHVLGWTLARVAYLTPDAFDEAPQETCIDRALDRFCGVMGYPAVLPLPRIQVGAVRDVERLSWRGKAPLCLRGALTAYPLSADEARHPRIRLAVLLQRRACSLLAEPHPRPVAHQLETVDLDARLFRHDSVHTASDVLVYAERDAPDEDLLALADAAYDLARVDAWPGPDEMRQQARARVARGAGVELPGQRKAREPAELRRKLPRSPWSR